MDWRIAARLCDLFIGLILLRVKNGPTRGSTWFSFGRWGGRAEWKERDFEGGKLGKSLGRLEKNFILRFGQNL
jgi:hypothetical protein